MESTESSDIKSEQIYLADKAERATFEGDYWFFINEEK